MTSLEIQQLLIAGIRNYDMAIRLKISGFNTENFKVSQDFDNLLDNIKNSPSGFIYVLSTYTAMIDFRKYLHSKGYIKKLW
jgi:hypothetical protein